jgi:nucleoside-diphosphate-sugar epimerase
MTGKEWVEAIAGKMGKRPSYRVAPLWMIQAFGWFMPIMKESVEMVYQYDRDYVFDSRKFEKEFGVQPTSYSDGIDAVIILL